MRQTSGHHTLSPSHHAVVRLALLLVLWGQGAQLMGADAGTGQSGTAQTQPGEGNPVTDGKTTEGTGLELTVTEAVLTALRNNPAFRIERLAPAIQRNLEQIESAVFDPRLEAEVEYDDRTGIDETRDVSAEAGVSRFFPTGTTAAARVGAAHSRENRAELRTREWEIEVTQALLRGRGSGVNLARLRQARLDTQLSEHEFRGAAEALVAAVELAYWDCVLAREEIDIYQRSLEVAEQQISEVRERIKIGKVAELELAAAAAEVAEKREELITARGNLATRLLVFRRLLNPGPSQWTCDVVFLDRPKAPEGPLDDVEAHVRLGLENRPELAQARLLIERDELELVRTRNGLLPQLDFFVRLGGTHYAGSFAVTEEDRDCQVTVGLALALPLGLREEKARHRNAQIRRDQAELALENMTQLVQLDVRTAHVQVEVAREQITATGATRKLREDTLTAEREKFRVGTSTTLQVAQAWRDLLASQINEVRAAVSYRKALIDLYHLESSLLQRRGVSLPADR